VTRTLRAAACVLIFAVLVPTLSAHAATVTGLSAVHRSGQTFLTWNTPSPSGWTYRIYTSWQPIRRTGDLVAAQLVGTCGDGTWRDDRLSALKGTTYAFCRDSAGTPLTENQAIYVTTANGTGFRYYAVTAQPNGGVEDRTVILNTNATGQFVLEQPAAPRPVWQREIQIIAGVILQDYVLWSSDRDTPYSPANANVSSFPFHCGVVRGNPAPDNILFLCAHQRGGNFLQATSVSKDTDWRLTFDDYLPNKDVASFWFGYHEDYNLTSDTNAPPSSGRVRGYTNARVVRLIDWAMANFPVDPARVYAFGHSMGGSFGVFLALTAGDRVAAVWSNVAKVDLADYRLSDLYPAMFEPMWGAAQTDLPTDQGMPVYERLRAATLAEVESPKEVAPIVSFSGRADQIVGWPEKIPFFRAVEANHLGGRYYWDQRGHGGPGGMDPEGSVWEILRYRRDKSWPALSNASCNDDPGTGDPASGDSIGALNACVDWDDEIVDLADRWEVLLKPRAIQTMSGTVPAPSFLTVDVTPKRLQKFVVHPGMLLQWEAKRMSDAEEVMGGEVMVDAYRRIIVTEVPVYDGGTRLRIHMPGVAGVGTPNPRRPLLAIDRAVVKSRASLSVSWPGTGDATLSLYDVTGRRIETYQRGPAQGQAKIDVNVQNVSPGVYFVRAAQGGESASLRFVVVH